MTHYHLVDEPAFNTRVYGDSDVNTCTEWTERLYAVTIYIDRAGHELGREITTFAPDGKPEARERYIRGDIDEIPILGPLFI